MKRETMMARLRECEAPWDIIVIGGGATGAGIAVDAASRGYSILLLEREDFGKGTSSRSTKLIHGGVRYLQQGNLPLVMEALKERDILRQNAPHLVHDLPFLVPNYLWWEKPYYGIGLKIYDLLAGRCRFGRSKILSQARTIERAPALTRNGLRGSVLYHDGQFDDARLLITLMMTAADLGAVVLNYASVIDLAKDQNGFVNSVLVMDRETGTQFQCRSRAVVNATGIFSDEIRRLANPAAPDMVTPSQGIHLVFDQSFLPGQTAIMVPHTPDGRLLFAIPWHEHTLVGTTDTPVDSSSYEPRPLEEEIHFILDTIARYLSKPPKRADVLSAFAGIRPLVETAHPGNRKTSSISRSHIIEVDPSHLITIAGGKWTTYRRMAEDAVNRAITVGKLEKRPCASATLRFHGYQSGDTKLMEVYGSDAARIRRIAESAPELEQQLDPDLPYIGAEVVWAVREEMAQTLDDVLARRLRALPLNAHAALRMAPTAAELLARELGKDQAWAQTQLQSFREIAAQYILV